MPRLLVLTLITLAAQVDAAEMTHQAQCGIYATDAALEIPDAVTYAMLTAMRCGSNEAKHCAIDASGLIESITKSINSILKAVQHCSNNKKMMTASAQCGMDASKLIESTASLSGAIAGMTAYCSPGAQVGSKRFDNNAIGSLTHCLLAGTDTVKSLLMIGMRAKQTDDACNQVQASPGSPDSAKGQACTFRALQLTSSLAEMTEYVLKAAGHCTSDVPPLCASKAIKLARAVLEIGVVVKKMTVERGSCQQSRLYLEGDDVIPSNSGSFVNMALAALLPAVAVLSFVAGSKWARATQPTMRDVDMANPSLE